MSLFKRPLGKKFRLGGIALMLGLIAGCSHPSDTSGNSEELAQQSREHWLAQQQKEHPDFDANDPEFTENARPVVRGEAHYQVETRPNRTPMNLGRVGIDDQPSVLDKVPLPATSATAQPRDTGEVYSRVVNPMADPNQPTQLRTQSDPNRLPVNKYGNPIKNSQQGQNTGKGSY